MNKKRIFLAIAFLVAIIFLGVFYFFRDKTNFYIKYYFTKVGFRYNLIDDELIYTFKNYRNTIALNLNTNFDLVIEEMLNLLGQQEDIAKFTRTPPHLGNPNNPYLIIAGSKLKLYNIALLVNKLKKEGNKDKDTREIKTLRLNRVMTHNASFEISLPKDRELINKKMIITNNGNSTIINPRVIINDKNNWFDIDSIIKSFIKPDMTDEEKALSTWNFMNNSDYHFYKLIDFRELLDVVKYLNIYGCGVCDDAATIFCALADKAGFKARMIALTGHFTVEAYYNNDWHLLDANQHVFYLEKDNKTIASVEDIADNPELIDRVLETKESFSGKSFSRESRQDRLYSTKENNGVIKPYIASKNHKMNFTLRPGESFIASRDNNGRYINNFYFTREPPVYGCGQFIYNPKLGNNFLSENIFEQENLKIIEKNNYRLLTADKPNQTAFFVLDFSTPYPILGGNLEIDCSLEKDKDRLGIFFSTDNKEWWGIHGLTGKPSSTNNLKVGMDFTNFFPQGYALPIYKYFLKFEFLSAKPSSLKIKDLKIVTETLLAPRSLPELENGKNIVNYISDSPHEQSTDIEFQYSFGKFYHPLLNPPKLNNPKNAKGGVVFSWMVPDNWDDNWGAIEYNYQLSLRKDFLVPLSINFDMRTKNNKFLVEKGWLNKQQTYFWRVRCRLKDEPWSDFSDAQKMLFNGI